jgi:GH3 auxin-responsive promoter
VLRFALTARFGRLSAVNPSTLLLLAQRISADAEALVRDVRDGGLRHEEVPAELSAALAGRLPADPARARALEQAIARDGNLTPAGAWPELRLLCCWIHAGAGLYRRDLEQAFGPLPVWDYGYTSSEGRVTVTARADGAGVPLIDLVFLELRGSDGRVRPLFAIGDGDGEGEGELLVTNSRGLYRYAMGDRVEVIGRLGRTPLLRFRGKTTAVASLTGEKLTEEHVVGAVEASLADLGLRARYFCLAPQWGAPPRYLLLFDPGSAVCDATAARLAIEVERRLVAGNPEYERKRETLRLRCIGVYLVEDGELERYQSRLLGQGRELARLKLPRISMDVELVRQFRGRVIEPA